MPELFGHTRAHVGRRHALLTPHNHVGSVMPGFTNANVVILISPAMGAKFSQLLVTFQAGGRALIEASGSQTFGYFQRGGGTVTIDGKKSKVSSGWYFFAPAGSAWSVTGVKANSQLTLFQKRYVPVADAPAPKALIADSAKVAGQPFLGDPAANLQVLLPATTAFDLAVNIFAYQPGGHLPFVEVHVMEHGLVMLDGQGVYRLEDAWYPVEKGDVIWMGPYCPQWFVAMGKQPARYLYYKDVNRAAH